MSEKYGVEVIESAVVASASALNVVSKVFNKQGLWHLLGLQTPVQVLSTLNFVKVKEELSDFSEAEREQVEAKFKETLDLVNKSVQLKMAESVDYIEKVVDLGEDVVDYGKKVYADGFEFFTRGKGLVQEAKKLVGINS